MCATTLPQSRQELLNGSEEASAHALVYAGSLRLASTTVSDLPGNNQHAILGSVEAAYCLCERASGIGFANIGDWFSSQHGYTGSKR